MLNSLALFLIILTVILASGFVFLLIKYRQNKKRSSLKNDEFNSSNKQSTPFWWSIRTTYEREYKCSDELLNICGLEPDNYTQEDFMRIIHPSHHNIIRHAIQQFHETGSYKETFKLLTQSGYRWVVSKFKNTTNNEDGTKTIFGDIFFLTEQEVSEAEEKETGASLSELIDRYSAVSGLLMELLGKEDDVSVVINKILKRLKEEFGADRSYLFNYNFEEGTQSCHYEIIRSGITSAIEDLQNIPLCETKWWTEMLINRQKTIVYNDIKDLEKDAPSEYELLKQQNIQSIMVVPLITKHEVCGYLGVEMVSKKRHWSDIDESWFRSMANIITICIELKKSEDTAQKERKHYQSLYENMPIGLIRMKLLYDQNNNPIDYVYTQANPAGCQILGNDNSNIVGKLASQLNACDRRLLTLMDQLIKAGNSENKRIGITINNRYLDYLFYVVEGDETVALVQDNTESIIASKALKKSESTLENIYKNIPVGIEIYDKDGFLISINDIEQEIFGFKSKEDVIGVNIFENPNVPASFLDDLKNKKAAWCDFFYDFKKLDLYYNSRLEGRKHIVLKGSVLFDADQNIENYLLIVLDNTDVFEANHKIKEFQLLFNSIAEFSKLGMSQWTPSSKKMFGTDQWHENMGQKSREMSDIMDSFSNAHPDDRERMEINFNKIINREITSFRDEIRIFNGEKWSWIKTNFKVSDYAIDRGGIEIIGINIDITEQKNIEKNLIEAKIKAEQSDKIKSAFLANMSHEIRTPLNAIVGFSDLLVDAKEPREREQYIQIIRQSNDLLLRLISDVLDLSKMESEIYDLIIEPLDPSSICRAVTLSFSEKYQGDVRLFFEENTEKCVIHCDKNRLTQILTSLVGNALKFTDKGEISVGYVVNHNEICFHVRDTGIGIEASELQSIFDRFHKINDFTQGTGLGLSICRLLAEKMGGKIWAESEFGKGSCFFVSLPIGETKKLNQ